MRVRPSSCSSRVARRAGTSWVKRAVPSDRDSRGRPSGPARFLSETAAFGVFGGGLIAAAGPDALYRIRAGHVIFATGAVEGSAVFPGNDLPGVMLSSAVHLLLHRYGVLPGRRAVVLTGDNVGYTTAWALKDAGAEVTVVDLRSDGGWPEGSRCSPGRRSCPRTGGGG